MTTELTIGWHKSQDVDNEKRCQDERLQAMASSYRGKQCSIQVLCVTSYHVSHS